MDRSSTKIKTAKKLTKMEIALCAYELIPVWTRWFSTVCPLSKIDRCRENQLLDKNLVTDSNKPEEMLWSCQNQDVESFSSTCQFLTRGSSLDAYVNEKVSTQKEDYTVVAQACFFVLSFSVISLVCMWGMAINGYKCGQSVTHLIHKKNNCINFFWRVWTHFWKILHQQKFLTMW